MTIDWSKAPEGTTHCHEGSPQPWRDLSGYNWKYFMNGEWHSCPSYCTSAELMRGLGTVLFALPLHKLWNGEGLPPVGKDVCEYRGAHQWDVWTVVNIFAEWGEGSRRVVFVDFGDGWREERDAERFRPIRTAEQIAAEERESAITDMCVLLGKDPNRAGVRAMAGVLYEAGYRKQVAEAINEDNIDIDFSIKQGDTVQTDSWSISTLEVIDVNWALRAIAVRLGPTGGIVVWPARGMKKVAP